ncbi:MAG TPA: redoxin domain-containing protein [Fimbriimonadaceae bacterium]|nr:redoxin domain-containing protein [Fimbriimonadaceae bacterium]
MKWILALALFSAHSFVIGGCGQGGSTAKAGDAESFLKWSMDQCAALKSYEATVDWKMTDAHSSRKIFYVKPNKFKISSDSQGQMTMTAVSNGAKLVEYTSDPSLPATSYGAPSTIFAANSMQMKHPMFDGSLFYQFFGGSSNFDHLVDKGKAKIEFGADEKGPGGEDARVVKFYGAETYGHVEALIGKKTGLVYRIQYDSEPLLDMMKSDPEFLKTAGANPKLLTTEIFSDVKTNAPIPESTFDCTPPKGANLTDGGKSEGERSVEPKAPVPVGKLAPDIEVTGLDGKKLKLSSLKGKIVMIDFWATWCPPCRASLPTTNKMHEKYASKGLQVVTVSDEDKDTVAKFVKDNRYTFPTFLDPGDKASKVYNVQAIPCLVIIDAQGNLSSYSVGLEPEENVLANLKKAGLKTD